MATPAQDSTFTFGPRLGIVFIAESAALSALAVSGLLLWIAFSAVRPVSHGVTSKRWTVCTHIHFYFLNLLVSDLIQAIGALFNIKWIIDDKVTEGPLCTAQGIFKQMGDVGVALSTMSIALHTLGVLVFGWRSPPRTALIVIACIWLFIGLVIGIPIAKNGHHYYGNTQFWCWITADYDQERLGLEYVWMYIAAFLNFFIYVFLALVIRGYLIVEGRRIRFQRGSTIRVQYLTDNSERTRSNAIAWHMMFYPIVYSITVTPIAITRWLAFDGKNVGYGWTIFASILFSASGFLNVLLFKFTRPKLMPSRDRDPAYPSGNEYWNTRDRFRRRASIRTSITDDDAGGSSHDLSNHSWKRDPENPLHRHPSVQLANINPSPPTPVYLGDSTPLTGVKITKEYHVS